MDANVASFDEFDNDQQIAAHHAGLPRVVLEGDTDVQLFSRFWFPIWQETFQFIEACKVGAGAGCTGVADAVALSRQDGIPAVGIVDKDTLFRNKEWARLFSLDAGALPIDWTINGVYVTSRWEVEAYLLEPDLLGAWVTVAHREPPGSQADCDQALARTIAACEALLVAAPYLASQHEGGAKVPLGFLYDQAVDRVREICEGKIEQSAENVKAVAAQVQELVSAIIANRPAEPNEGLPFLLRYVDTKRLFNRLGHVLRIRDVSNWAHLAQAMLSGGRRPTELEQVLRSIETSLVA
jgi:hypothetical protein